MPFVFDFARYRDGRYKPQTLPCGRCPHRCTSRRRWQVYNCGYHPRVGLACLARLSYFLSSQLKQPLVSLCLRSLLGFVKSSSHQHGHHFNNFLGFIPVMLARPQTRQKLLLAPSTMLHHLRPIRPQLLGLQALASLPINHHLVD